MTRSMERRARSFAATETFQLKSPTGKIGKRIVVSASNHGLHMTIEITTSALLSWTDIADIATLVGSKLKRNTLRTAERKQRTSKPQ